MTTGLQIRCSFQILKHLFLNQLLKCAHSFESSLRDDLNGSHFFGFGVEIKEIFLKMLENWSPEFLGTAVKQQFQLPEVPKPVNSLVYIAARRNSSPVSMQKKISALICVSVKNVFCLFY